MQHWFIRLSTWITFDHTKLKNQNTLKEAANLVRSAILYVAGLSRMIRIRNAMCAIRIFVMLAVGQMKFLFTFGCVCTHLLSKLSSGITLRCWIKVWANKLSQKRFKIFSEMQSVSIFVTMVDNMWASMII